LPPRINQVSLAPLPNLSDIKAERRERERQRDKQSRADSIAAQATLPKMREMEGRAEEKRQKEKRERIRRDIANLKVDPMEGRSPDGKMIRVDRNSGPGHLLALHKQNPVIWTKPMVDAGGRFGRDYDLAEFRGLGGMGLEPKVDSSGTSKDGATAAGIVARSRLRDLQARLGADYYAILVLVCGVGFTFTELHSKGLGEKRTLSDKMRVALNKAAAFYSGTKEEPMSDFLVKAHRLVESIKNRA
jgi:hypothetical protein